MVIDGIKYGISYLPDGCMAYRDGYRYAAYKANVNDRDSMHITGWFKVKEEIQAFVNKHREYAKQA